MSRVTTQLLILMTIIALFWSCSESQSSPAGFHQITVEEAYQMIQQNSRIAVIDVRTPQEYDGDLGHISGSELKPVGQIEKWAPQIESLKDSEIILVCRSGNRSNYAAEFLKEMGFRKLYNVEGGMRAWNSKGLPVKK